MAKERKVNKVGGTVRSMHSQLPIRPPQGKEAGPRSMKPNAKKGGPATGASDGPAR